MSKYEELQGVDKEIADALKNGSSDEEVKSSFGIEDEKLAEIHAVLAEDEKPEGEKPEGEEA